MTTEELEKVGIFYCGSKLHPRNFFLPQVGEVSIPEYYTMDSIFELIYEHGFEIGIARGKVIKAEEIKSCLFINPE